MGYDSKPDRNFNSSELDETTTRGNESNFPSLLPKLQQRLLLPRQNTMATSAHCSNLDATNTSITNNNEDIVSPELYEHQPCVIVTHSEDTETSGVAKTFHNRNLSSASFLSTLLLRRTIRTASSTCSFTCSTAQDSSTSITSSGTLRKATHSATYLRNRNSNSIFNRESGLRHHHQPVSQTTPTGHNSNRGTNSVPTTQIPERMDHQQPLRSQAYCGEKFSISTSTSSCLQEREARSPSFQADKLNTTTTTSTTTTSVAHRLNGTVQQQQVIMGNSFCTDCRHTSITQHSKSNGLACPETNGRSTIIVAESKSFSSYIPFFRGPSLQDTVRNFLVGKQEERQEQHNDHHHLKNLLFGCTSVSQHVDKVKETLLATKSQYGSVGLRYAGFEYRSTDSSHTRLFHIDTDTCITERNRQLYISDGCMYEEITRLAQETAQEIMIREGDLQWIDICDKDVPVRALVSPSYTHAQSSSSIDTVNTEHQADQSSTFLITTGKGYVRAGIFSRKHLIVTGLEASTALPHIREAKKRQMRIVMIDPNARGDRLGMDTFALSMKKIFDKTGSLPSYNDKVYILAHSQAGAQLVRFLLDDYNRHETEQLKIKAIAFTDSTHNIQWTKANPNLSQLLSGRTSIYLKSTPATGTPNNSYNNTCNANNHQNKNIEEIDVGKTLDTDHYWKHRFGTIRTLSAGTSVHELVNWTGRTCIWEHFDEHLID